MNSFARCSFTILLFALVLSGCSEPAGEGAESETETSPEPAAEAFVSDLEPSPETTQDTVESEAEPSPEAAEEAVENEPQPGAQQPPATEALFDIPEELLPADLSVETSCSEIEMRTADATLKWTGNPDLVEWQRVDVTVFEQGFEEGLFGTFNLRDGPQSEIEVQGLSDRGLPALTNLRFTELNYDDEFEEMSATISGLEAGLNYFWRLQTETADEPVMTRPALTAAPTCVADIISE